MGSSKYVGYVGGVAVAVGVGAAIAAASQGVASADTGNSGSSSSSDSAKSDSGPKKSATGTSKRTKPVSKLNGTVTSAAANTKSAASTPTSAKTTAASFESTQVEKLEGLFKGTGHSAPRPAAATESTDTTSTAAATTESTETTETTAAATAAATVNPATAFWNPFRWMPPEPAPQDMPGPIWTLELSFMSVFPNDIKAVGREGFELGYRLTQMIPWVNIIVPFTNIATDLPAAFDGDKAAAQRVINNLIVTIHPVAVLYYGYNEVADVLNLEAPALQLQEWFISSLWNLFDPFALLHNRGESGLPLSTTTPPPDQVTPESAAATTLAAAVTPSASDAPSTTIDFPDQIDPFPADDPAPIGMPAAIYSIEKGLVALFPADVQPVVRELYELSWRVSQMTPSLNAVVPVAELLPSLLQAALGHKDTSQAAINAVLLTTTPLSILYYGYDELADLLNVEEDAQALKAEIYAAVWDEVDPNGYLHVPGHSGLQTV
ncbi:hypothetical protein ORI20_30115 [Mycobacterium sp. CVI_P3]|uniref:Uncharacterized protein n=1 Tax=Mycobacterium pinniadriaticum TaxID=2994102 RepID=A0ABT3SN36_9MYCO|nr:hypothetical protein [Mycobacterium pinniadriaticum]MCX2934527.1 hypothetical protein [Mycobacterium pinniadriaticum]MCX2940950.1 hypothetical protein [Mycobacterium pinniadriaticum]